MNFKELTFILIDGKPHLLTDELIGKHIALGLKDGTVKIMEYTEIFDQEYDWVKGVFAFPEEIGYLYLGATATDNGWKHDIAELGELEINHILQVEKGRCKVEIMEPHFLTKDDVQPEHVKFEPIKLNDKIIVYLV